MSVDTITMQNGKMDRGLLKKDCGFHVNSEKKIEVIKKSVVFGAGTPDDLCVAIDFFFDLDGNFLAQSEADVYEISFKPGYSGDSES